MNTPDLELALIGTMLEGGVTLSNIRAFVEEHRITADYFTSNEARSAFQRILASQSTEPVLIQADVAKEVGREWMENALARTIPLPADIDRALCKFRDDYRTTQISDLTSQLQRKYKNNGGPELLLHRLIDECGNLLQTFHRTADEGISLADIADPIPEDKDPNVLFRDRWLCKGQGVFLISTAGSGKSVLVMQLAYAWALGESAFDIEPIRPMKIAIFQPEDDPEEIAMFRKSMRTGYREQFGWTDAELSEAERKVDNYFPKGNSNQEFLEQFSRIQATKKYDLVIINPLQGVTDFDLGENVLLNNFFNNNFLSLGSIIKHGPAPCGLLIVHHTNKPPQGPYTNSFGRNNFAQYIGAGGQVINGWTRAVLTLLPAKAMSNDGAYHLIAAKRERHLPWTIPAGVDSAKPLKIIAQEPRESGYMFWHEVEATKSSPTKSPSPQFDLDSAAKQLVEQIKQANRKFTATEVRNLARQKFNRGDGDKVYPYLLKNAEKFNITIQKGTKNNEKFIAVGGFPQ